MSEFDAIVEQAVRELTDAGYFADKTTIARRLRLKDKQVSRALTSLRRRGMIVPRRWDAPAGTFIPAPRSNDVEGVPAGEV